MEWTRRLTPGVPDLAFGLVLVLVLIGGRTAFLNDPGTFWHVRLGREIARTRDVPRYDTLTSSRDRVAWVDQSWAFDLTLASVVDRWGWSAAIAATALGLAALSGALARDLVRQGIAPLIAVVVTLLATAVGAIHFLVRPHVFTMAFVFWTLRVCRAQHERGGWVIAILPPMMVLWANVHGGFLAGPVIVASAALGHAISGPWPWDRARRADLAKFTAAFVLCLLAPLVNPYGFGLYRHVGHLLFTSGVTSLIQEYQPIPFGTGMARVFEWVVLGLIALPSFSTRRLGRYDLVHVLVWLHLSLACLRHAPLFALAVAPGLARMLDGLPLARRDAGHVRLGWSAWPVATALALVLAVGLGVRLGGFSPRTWPLEALATLDRQPVEAQLFHEQDWGGMIEERCRPRRRAFLDDRFELFGKEAILQYSDALKGGPEWDTLDGRQRFEVVWVRPDRGLARRLLADPGWQVLHRDVVSVLFRRKESPAVGQARRDPPDATSGARPTS